MTPVHLLGINYSLKNINSIQDEIMDVNKVYILG